MAGIVPVPLKKSGRKQWTIHDGPKGSLRRLQSQMAEDGCPESQVVLAKKLLEEKCGIETEEEENARVAVYWLIKASEQGHDEGTAILRNCLKTGQGITEHNYLDVKTCLGMTMDEKLARRAARKLFSSLSAGQDFITTDQLRRRVESLDGSGFKIKKGSHRKKNDSSADTNHCEEIYSELNRNGDAKGEPSDLPQVDTALDAEGIEEYDQNSKDSKIDWVLRSEGYAGEKLTEEHLLSAASAYSRGQLPMVHRVLCLTAPHIRALHRLDSFRRSLLHPRLCLALFHSRILETFAGNGKGRSASSSSFKHCLRIFPFLMVIIAYISIHSGSEILHSLWPLLIAVMHPLLPVLHYGALAVMVSASCRVCWQLSERRELRIWSRLLVAHVPELDPSEAEGRHARGDLHPWVQFFAALLVHVATVTCVISGSGESSGTTESNSSGEGIVGNWQSPWPLLHSEVTVLSLSMMLAMLLAPPRSPFLSTSSPSPSSLASDPLSLICVALHVVSRYPYERDGVALSWRLLDVRHPSEPLGRLAAAALRFCLASRTALSLAVPVILLVVSIRDARRAMSSSTRNMGRNASNGTQRSNLRQLNAAEVMVASMEHVVPLCMALAWWQVAMLAAVGATSQGLLRAALATIGLFICVPLLGLSLLFLPIITLAQQLHSAAEGASHWLMAPSAILAAIALPLGLLLPMHHRRRGQPLWSYVSRCAVLIQISCAALAVVSLTSAYLSEPATSVGPFLAGASDSNSANAPDEGLSHNDHVESLSWELYNQECHYPAWERTSRALTSLTCRQLVGTPVAWDGYVSSVRLARPQFNFASSVLSLMPRRLAAHLACVIGEPTHSPSKGIVRGRGVYGSGCHLESLSQDVVEVWVRVGSGRGVWGVASGSGAEVVLVSALEDDIGSGKWSNFSLSLRAGDRVWFSGELASGRLGDENPEILVKEAGCLACRSSHPGFSFSEKTSSSKNKFLTFGKALWNAFSVLLSFLLGPIVL